MAVRVRLTRVGSKKNPIWRVVVADRRSPRDGRFIETIGHYNPQTQPSTIVLDHERLEHWLDLGAEPTNTVKKLMRAKDNPQVAAAVVEEATEAAGRGRRGGRRRRGGRAAEPEAAPERRGGAEPPRPRQRAEAEGDAGRGEPSRDEPPSRRPWRTCSHSWRGASWTTPTRSSSTPSRRTTARSCSSCPWPTSDAGKVIGRGGRTIAALRTVVKASSVRENRRVLVDVVDPE